MAYDRDLDQVLESVTSILSGITDKAVSVQSSYLFNKLKNRSKSAISFKNSSLGTLSTGTKSAMNFSTSTFAQENVSGDEKNRPENRDLYQRSDVNKIKNFYEQKLSQQKGDKEFLEDCYDQYFHTLKILKKVGVKIVKNNYEVLGDEEMSQKSIKHNLAFPTLLLRQDRILKIGKFCL